MSRKKLQPKTPEQLAYAYQAALRKKLQDEVNKAALVEAERLCKTNPEYAGLVIKPMNIAYAKGRKGISKAYFKIADLIAQPSNAKKTQAAIAEEVQSQFPELKIRPNIWNKVLSTRLKDRIHQRIYCNMAIPPDLRGSDTLAKIRKRIIAAKQDAEGLYSFKMQVTFSHEAVLIGKNSYRTIVRKSGKKTYSCIRVDLKDRGRCWVRVDGLLEAFKNNQ